MCNVQHYRALLFFVVVLQLFYALNNPEYCEQGETANKKGNGKLSHEDTFIVDWIANCKE